MRWLTLAVCVWFLVDGASLGVALDNANAPDAEHAPVFRETTPFVAAITVRNPNDRAVQVKLLDASCTCATLEIKDRFLLPHATTTLSIAVANQERSGPQHIGVSIYLTDPDYEAIEVNAWWTVRACVQVDAIGATMDPAVRPADRAWQDVYRYVAKVRPDELNRMKKRIRVSCPAEELPPGGLKIEGIDYSGTLWAFTQAAQADGSILITASARDVNAEVKEGEYDEKATLRTNHPDKPAIELRFLAVIAKDAGARVVDPGAPGK